jgi:hypothetical protein
MKTKRLMIGAAILAASLNILLAQSDEKSERRPFAERIYGELSFGWLRVEMTNWMGNLAVGYRITPHIYLGVERVPGFSSQNIGRSHGVGDGWGIQSQLRLGKWYAFGGKGYLGSAGIGTDGPELNFTYELPSSFSYFRYGMKYCFNQWFSLGFQYAQSDYFDGYAVDDPPHSGGDIRPWSYRIECLTINLGVMVQKVPKKKHKN